MECTAVTGNASMLLKVVTQSRAQLAKVIANLEEYGNTTTSLILEAHEEKNVLKKKRSIK